ncbi:hypothetical protein CsatA_014098 [Cannabis sativa]
MFSSTTPHFFKIIFQETHKLHIPKKFTRKYGETLSNSVLIKLPCGSKWKMGLTKKDENVWFEKGWLDFAEHYAIKRGSILSFRYEGNSEFNAVIVDLSLVEIDYPSVPTNLVSSNIDDSDIKIPKREVFEDENLDVFSPSHRMREKTSLPCSRPQKKMRTQSNPCCRKLESETKGKHNLPNATGQMKLSSPSRRDEASEFKSSRPFFKVVMRPYSVRGSMMNLPSSFAKEYLEARATCSNAILKLPNGCGRTWSVLCKFKVYNHEVISSRFQAGWPAFVKDNNLKLGDVCVFVLLEDITFTFEVVIFRGKQDKDAMDGETVMPNGRVTTLPTPKKQQQYFSMIEKAKLLEMAQFKSEYPFFKIVIYPSFLGSRYYMEVPMEFAKRNLKKEGDAILSVSDSGGYWPIQFEMRHMKSKGKVRAEFRCGWKEFAKDNELKVGDVCIFELLKRSENLFRVSILCAVDDENDAYHKNCQGGGSNPKIEVGEKLASFSELALY